MDGKCVFCTQKGCGEICIHWGKPICTKTLLAEGERLYLEGKEAEGVKYYGLALYAKEAFGYAKCPPAPVQARPAVPASKFESLEERKERNEEFAQVLRQQKVAGRGGVFGVFTPKPVNHEAAMGFQHWHDHVK